MNPFKVIKYQLYLLQLENYELGRYWVLLFKKGLFPRGEQRKDLVWSKKARSLAVMAAGLHLFAVIAILYRGIDVSMSVAALLWILILVLFYCYFILFTAALILLTPLDYLAKKNIVSQAKRKLDSMPELKVIGIAGSYGKTTMKEVLRAVLSTKFSVLSTPDSINTPVGIGRWVLNKVNDETQIIIVEMGEHYQYDIMEICEMAKPDIAVITGINESHLERMKKMETVINTVFEIVSSAKPGSTIVVNGDDRLVMENYKKYIWKDQKVEQYQISNFKSQNFDASKLVWSGEIDQLGKIEAGLLGEYGLADVDAAVKVGKLLGMTSQQIVEGAKKIKPVEHRLQPIKSAGDILVIDDSYNGNPAGVKEAIKVLAQFKNRRKLFITPGLVEMGKASPEIHREIGRQLAAVADVVILVKNSVTGFIEEGIGGKSEIIKFETATEAHASLGKILKPEDVIVFQNDWGDQYL